MASGSIWGFLGHRESPIVRFVFAELTEQSSAADAVGNKGLARQLAGGSRAAIKIARPRRHLLKERIPTARARLISITVVRGYYCKTQNALLVIPMSKNPISTRSHR